MPNFKNILVFVRTDADRQPGLERAVKLCERSKGRLHLVDVVDELPVYLRLPQYGYPALVETLKQEKAAKLSELADRARAEGVRVETSVLYGKPFLVIIREVLRRGHDLVMKVAERDGLAKLFGNTDLRLFRKSPCAVWVLKPVRTRRYERVLAAVDPLHDEGQAFNIKIVELAAALARLEGAELHILHAWNAFGGRVLEGLETLPEKAIKKYVRISRKSAKQALEGLLSQLQVRIPRSRVHLLEGDPGLVIRDFAARRRVGVIVMGTVVRTGVPGILIGGTADKVLKTVDCSVLAVKPDGFVSPVKLPPPAGRDASSEET